MDDQSIDRLVRMDLEKIVTSEDVEDVMAKIRGVIVLLDSLEIAAEGGTHKYQKDAYTAMCVSLESAIDDLRKVQNNADYVHGFARMFWGGGRNG